jgi:hypothetical protein
MRFITDHLSKEHAKLVEEKAKKLFAPGLGLFGAVGPVYKRQAKVKSERGYPDEMCVMARCHMSITGFVSNDGEVHVWPAFVNEEQWFKTSPVVNVKVQGATVIIETQNSIYEVVL